MARLYSNENFPRQVVERLRELGHDVATIQEQEHDNEALDNAAVLQLAADQQRVLLTLNRRDFIRLHRNTPHHAGIVVCTVDPDFGSQADRIHAARLDAVDLIGRLIRVNRNP